VRAEVPGNGVGAAVRLRSADRKRTAAPTPLPGTSARTGGRGQRVSLERGVSTRSKKNPGKRPSKGG